MSVELIPAKTYLYALNQNAELRAEIKRLQSTLVTKRDMQDAEKLAEMIAESIAAGEEPFMVIDWRHDIAQAIADGRRENKP